MITYRIMDGFDSTVEYIKKTEEDGTVWTFRSDGKNNYAREYQDWLAEGNEPLPAD